MNRRSLLIAGLAAPTTVTSLGDGEPIAQNALAQATSPGDDPLMLISPTHPVEV